ncbi:hypothetical protein Pan241w_06270 [Gimesia alba]|uniref:Secretin/TonB short N-terminal domain-containing protein n=1 Tax=Gimesia alba TaxID=2527973 RepID=A0A517R9K4_9PLAN|nr:STN domain-containing protein [Gimesia alba]QDT40570.1 hypothetical protein Pan241w_06270 [Gimesia alba]
MSGLFKQKFVVASMFCLAAAGFLLVANAEEKQKVKSAQAKKPSVPAALPVLDVSVAEPLQPTTPLFFPELTKFEKQFQEQLKENVEAEFVDAPLSDVMKFYEDSTGANIVIFANDLGEEGLTVDEPVAISLEKVSLKTALELILEPIGLTYVVDRDVVKITTKYKAAEMLKTRVYPVGDFGNSPQDYVALEVAIRNAGLGQWRERKTSATPPQPAQAGGFGGGGGGLGGGGGGFFQLGGGGGFGGGVPGMGQSSAVYEEGEGGTISVVPQSKSLVISQTYRAHNAIVDLLTQLRQARAIE